MELYSRGVCVVFDVVVSFEVVSACGGVIRSRCRRVVVSFEVVSSVSACGVVFDHSKWCWRVVVSFEVVSFKVVSSSIIQSGVGVWSYKHWRRLRWRVVVSLMGAKTGLLRIGHPLHPSQSTDPYVSLYRSVCPSVCPPLNTSDRMQLITHWVSRLVAADGSVLRSTACMIMRCYHRSNHPIR
jgi:hypothetical protein